MAMADKSPLESKLLDDYWKEFHEIIEEDDPDIPVEDERSKTPGKCEVFTY